VCCWMNIKVMGRERVEGTGAARQTDGLPCTNWRRTSRRYLFFLLGLLPHSDDDIRTSSRRSGGARLLSSLAHHRHRHHHPPRIFAHSTV
jgi:hypothetical protein